jgi:hypothetical protein
MIAGDQLTSVETVIAATVQLCHADDDQTVIVGQDMLLRAQAHRVPALHTTKIEHKIKTS